MDRELLDNLLRDTESDRAERTISLSDTRKFCEAICAFSNDLPGHGLPGYLFVGANGDGTACGATIDDQLLQNLAAARSDGNILPPPVMNVQKWTLGGGEMAVVEVLPSDAPPVRYRGRVYVRVGPRRGIATQSEERILAERRTARARTWDVRACRDASLSDLALDLFVLNYRQFAVAREVIDQNDRPIEQQLASLRFFDLRYGCPTNAAILLFGKDPISFFPGAYVQYVQYGGTSQADEVIRERRLGGDLLSVMRGLDQLSEDIAVARPVKSSGLGERTVFDYPPRSMHELLMNTVIHRNYEDSSTPTMINHFGDRIEILNPGGLYGDLTPAQFPHGTSYRNPVVAEAAKTWGFVNRYGRGIAVAQSVLRQNGSQEAEFGLEPNHVLVTVRKRP
jgi:ATP-dependent DNA helicase RecG